MQIETGDTVVVVYDGQLDNGEIFDSSASSGPLEFIIGEGSVMPGFEAEIIGMGPGEKKSFTLAADAAHGPSNPELIHTVERSVLPNQGQLAVGICAVCLCSRFFFCLCEPACGNRCAAALWRCPGNDDRPWRLGGRATA